MNVADEERKKERVELLQKMLKEEFVNFEELHGKGGRQYGLDCEAELAVEHSSGRPRVILCPSRELLTDVGLPFETRFKEAIEQAKHYLKNEKGLCVVQVLSGGVKLHEISGG